MSNNTCDATNSESPIEINVNVINVNLSNPKSLKKQRIKDMYAKAELMKSLDRDIELINQVFRKINDLLS